MEAGEIVTEKLRDGSGSWSTFLSRRMLKPVSVAFTAALLLRLDLELHLSEVDIAAGRTRLTRPLPCFDHTGRSSAMTSCSADVRPSKSRPREAGTDGGIGTNRPSSNRALMRSSSLSLCCPSCSLYFC